MYIIYYVIDITYLIPLMYLVVYLFQLELICIHCRLKIVAECIHNGINSRSREIQ